MAAASPATADSPAVTAASPKGDRARSRMVGETRLSGMVRKSSAPSARDSPGQERHLAAGKAGHEGFLGDLDGSRLAGYGAGVEAGR